MTNQKEHDAHEARQTYDGRPPYRITGDLKLESDRISRLRRSYIQHAMQYTWNGYLDHAFGYDEVILTGSRPRPRPTVTEYRNKGCTRNTYIGIEIDNDRNEQGKHNKSKLLPCK